MLEPAERTSTDYAGIAQTGSTLRSEVSPEGELPCLMVFSGRKHVDYIYPLLEQLESVLKIKGFKPQRLGDEIRSGGDYLETLRKLIEDCVLGVVVLDGFRPNVLFEFGFLKGMGKPVILIQDSSAYINIKTLYKQITASALTERAFNTSLSNPPLDVAFHLSDFAGKHICYIDHNARQGDARHPCKTLEEQLTKIEQEILEASINVTKSSVKTLEPAALQELIPPLMSLVGLNIGAAELKADNIEDTNKKIASIARKYNLQLPYELRSMIAGIYMAKAREIGWKDAKATLGHLRSAINIYTEMLGR